MYLPQLQDLGDVRSKRVLVRSDLNAPMVERSGKWVVADDFRIRSALPTFRWLLDRGAEVVTCSHLGRPKGSMDPKFSMAPVQELLSTLLPEVAVMENLRFNPGEESNSEEFAKELVDGFDFFVSDAFGAAHRKHASIVGPPKYLPSVAGKVLAEEVEMLAKLLEEPMRPFVSVMGGSKVSDKLGLLSSLLAKVDTVLVGGGMCFTFLAAQGFPVGESMVEPDMIESCRAMLATGKIVLPSDIVGLAESEPFGRSGGTAEPKIFSHGVPEGFKGLDIGPSSVERFSTVLATAKTILWNGPMGVFEDPRLNSGTFAIAKAVATSDSYSVVGGGDSAAAIVECGLEGSVSHLSTGGGASLEFIEKGDLPGLKALRDAWRR